MADKKISIKLDQDSYVVKSGEITEIKATVIGGEKGKEPQLLFTAQKGSVNTQGKYRAPEVVEDDCDIITITSAEDNTVQETVNVQVVFEDEAQGFVRIGEIKAIGRDGCYAINIQCLNKRKIGHGCSIVVTDYDQALSPILPDENDPYKDGYVKDKPTITKWSDFQIRVKTSKMGFVSLHLQSFQEKIRKLHVRVKGSEIDREVVLKGPKSKVKFNPNDGFWANASQN